MFIRIKCIWKIYAKTRNLCTMDRLPIYSKFTFMFLNHSWMCRKQKQKKFLGHFVWDRGKFLQYFILSPSVPDIMCCCCLVSTIWLFFICFNAKLLCLLSPAIITSSTRPNPPTPRVAIIRRSDNFRGLNSSWMLEY